eukprot:scaffold456_cov368-Pavlova_lutheri.AAC.7
MFISLHPSALSCDLTPTWPYVLQILRFAKGLSLLFHDGIVWTWRRLGNSNLQQKNVWPTTSRIELSTLSKGWPKLLNGQSSKVS